jgi:hypothetical protein
MRSFIFFIALFTFLTSCQKESPCSHERIGLTTNVIWPIGGICGNRDFRDLLNENNQPKGSLFTYNDHQYQYLDVQLDDGYVASNIYIHFSETSNFPVDSQNNPDVTVFGYKYHMDYPTSFWRIRWKKGKIPLNGFVSLCVAAIHPENQGDCKQTRLWADGIRYGSSIRGRYFYYTWTNCLSTHPKPSEHE